MKIGIAQGGVARTSLSEAIGLSEAFIVPARTSAMLHSVSVASADPASASLPWLGSDVQTLSTPLQSFVDSSKVISSALPGVSLGPLDTFTDMAKLGVAAETGNLWGMVRPGLSLAQDGLEAGFPGAEGIPIAFAAGKLAVAYQEGDTKGMISGAAEMVGGALGALNASGLIGHHTALAVTAEALKATPKIVSTFAPVFADIRPASSASD